VFKRCKMVFLLRKRVILIKKWAFLILKMCFVGHFENGGCVILNWCRGCRWRSRRQCLRRWAGNVFNRLEMVELVRKCVILYKRWAFLIRKSAFF
jgi:hypothetical protein